MTEERKQHIDQLKGKRAELRDRRKAITDVICDMVRRHEPAEDVNKALRSVKDKLNELELRSIEVETEILALGGHL